MNPYPQRMDELHAWLESKYGVRDRVATEVMLAACLPGSLTHMMVPWLIVEMDYPTREFSAAWFNFATDVPYIHSLAEPRVMRGENAIDLMIAWMDARGDGHKLFVESEWRKIPGLGRQARMLSGGAYGMLLSQCVRLRTEYPKVMTFVDRDADRIELQRLTRRVLDSSLRVPMSYSVPAADGSNVVSTHITSQLSYWAELVQVLAPLQSDWNVLMGSLVSIAVGIGVLYNDGVARWHAAERVLRDCIPSTIETVIRRCDSAGVHGARPADLFKACGEISLGSNAPMWKEIHRLYARDVLAAGYKFKIAFKPSRPHRYRVANPDWVTLVDRSQRLFAV